MVFEVSKPARKSSARVSDEELRERIEAAKSSKSEKFVVLDFVEVKPKKNEAIEDAEERAKRAIRSSQRYGVKRVNNLFRLEVPGSWPTPKRVMSTLGLHSSVFAVEHEGKHIAVWAVRKM